MTATQTKTKTPATAEQSVRKVLYLTFPPSISGKPYVCNLATRYNLTFNILKAKITPRQEGFMTLELRGTRTDYDAGMKYLKSSGVRFTPVAQRISREEEVCIHCGLCTALCPTGALLVDSASRVIVFDTEECTACGLCSRVCPVHAMTLDVDPDMLK